MAASSGRLFTVSKNATVLAGLRENSLSFDGSPVDVTSKDDSGFRTLGSFAGMKSFEMSVSGVLSDAVLQDLALTPGSSLLLTDVTMDFADGAELSGDVYFASFEVTGAHDGANEYTGTLQSSGQWSYTAAV